MYLRILSSTGWNKNWYDWKIVCQYVLKALNVNVSCGLEIPALGIYYKEIVIDFY